MDGENQGRVARIRVGACGSDQRPGIVRRSLCSISIITIICIIGIIYIHLAICIINISNIRTVFAIFEDQIACHACRATINIRNSISRINSIYH